MMAKKLLLRLKASFDSVPSFLLFLTIILLPTQIGKHFWPEFSYIYSLKIDYLSPVLYLWDLIALGLFLSWTLTKPIFESKIVFVLLIYLLTQLISILGSSNIGAGLVRFEQIMITSVFALYLAHQKWEQIKKYIMLGLPIAVISSSLLGLYQTTFGSSLGLWFLGERDFNILTPSIATFNWYGAVFLRAYATFPHPNVLGAFLIVAATLIYKLGDKKLLVNKVALTLATLVSLLTFSRTVFLVLLVQLASVTRKKLKLLILVLVILLPIIYVRFGSAFNFDSLTIIRRAELSEIALLQFKNAPFLGVGLNNFINQVATSSLISGPNRFLQPSHNILLLQLAETGLIGTLGFLVLIGSAMSRCWRYKDQTLFKALLYCWGLILFLGMFDHYFLTLAQGQRLLFLIIGCSFLKGK